MRYASSFIAVMIAVAASGCVVAASDEAATESVGTSQHAVATDPRSPPATPTATMPGVSRSLTPAARAALESAAGGPTPDPWHGANEGPTPDPWNPPAQADPGASTGSGDDPKRPR